MKKKKYFSTLLTVYQDVNIPWVLVFFSIVASFLVANAMVKSAFITAQVVDSSGNLNGNELVDFVVFTMAGSLLSVLAMFLNNLITEKINLDVRAKVWKKMLKLPLSYYDKESGETLVSRITTDCDKASGFIGVLIMTSSSLYGFVIAVKSMYSFSAELTLWSIVLVPIVGIGVVLSGRLMCTLVSKYYYSRAATTTYLLERVKNFRLVRSSNMIDEEAKQGNKLIHNLFSTFVKYTLSESLMTSFMGFTPIGLIIITFIIGGIKIAAKDMSVGTVIGFYSVSTLASVRISALITVYGDFASTNGVFEKITQVLNAEEENDNGRPMDLPDEDIRLKDVTFGYTDKKILKGVNAVIPKNKITAVIGNNGAGKTTFFKLLERMYEPESGEIFFGDVAIKDIHPVSWRRSFALVSQDRPLLSGTIRDNITYGCNRNVTEEEMIKVAQQANLSELIQSLPDGFETRVEPNGSNFSGGQRQCIAIARAIMRNPDYLLLDEATSNLDAKSEQVVTSALSNLMKDRTTIMIAHSLSVISKADHIIVLNNGTTEACGTPEEVAQASEIFREFVKSQMASATF